MKILYIGDIMGEVGIETVETVLPNLAQEKNIDFVIAQGENVTEGKGISPEDYQHLRDIGIDFFTAGNWTLHRPEIWPYLKDPDAPIIKPANYLDTDPGIGYKFIEKNAKKILVVSLLGSIVGKDADKPMNNPLKTIDKILHETQDENKDATVVNLHGDFSSQKVIIGHYLDGRATLVVGDHWHVPTADARVLDKGTAHITDVGMCGILDGSLGVTLDSVIPRWRDDVQTRNVLQTEGRKQFNSVLVDVDERGLAKSIEQIQRYLD